MRAIALTLGGAAAAVTFAMLLVGLGHLAGAAAVRVSLLLPLGWLIYADHRKGDHVGAGILWMLAAWLAVSIWEGAAPSNPIARPGGMSL